MPIPRCCGRWGARCSTTTTRPSRCSTRASCRRRRRRCGCPNTPLILHGEPVLGLEAAAASLIAPDDVVLNLASGVYGKGFGYWAKRYSPKLLEIEVPYNEAIDPQSVADMLKTHPEITHRLGLPSRHAVGHDQSDQRDRHAGVARMAAISSSMRSPPSAAWTPIPTTARPTSTSPVRTSASVLRRP